MNRDSKTKGGIIGISQDYKAVEKWALTAHLRAAVHANFKDVCRVEEKSYENELSRKSTTDSEERVLKIIAAFKEYENPFAFSSTKKSKLKNIVTGSVVRPEFLHDILDAKTIGKQHLDYFINERFFEGKISFWDSVKKLNLKTFSSGDKAVVCKKNNETITLKTDINLFSRLITVSRDRHIDLQHVLSHELSAVPLALFYPNGEMRKTSKSKLLKQIEIAQLSQQSLTEYQYTSATIIDFMATIQSIDYSKFERFSNVADGITSKILSSFQDNNFLVIVPDRYDFELSIKTAERLRRTETSCQEIEIIGNRKVPKSFQSYFGNASNKVNLVNYIFQHWKESLSGHLSSFQSVFLANLDGTTDCATSECCNRIEFYCNHEEADTKMFSYVKFLCDTAHLKQVIIDSPDTDVAVISLYQYATNLTSLDSMWFKTGTGNEQRFLPIHTLASQHGLSICRLLPAIHSITGCDSVSSLSRIGKKKAFQILVKKIDDLKDMSNFGELPSLSLECPSVVAAIQFVCYLYQENKANSNINELRYEIFTKKNMSGDRLPPTLDALVFHLRRANYQTFIWKSACVPVLNLPTPIENGWQIVDGKFCEEHMLQSSVPEAIVELTRCKCTKGCKTKSCSCKRANLVCTDSCSCNINDDCENTNYYRACESDEEDTELDEY